MKNCNSNENKSTPLIKTKEHFEDFVCHKWDEIHQYLSKMRHDLPVPFYSSVDIRESKNKYAPVDHNMYPAGFNNLCSIDLDNAVMTVKNALLKRNPKTKKVGIFPESHTKNLFYLDHLVSLRKVIEAGGFDVEILSFDPDLFDQGKMAIELVSHSEIPLTITRATLTEGRILSSKQETIDIVICNNDQSNPWQINWNSVLTPIHPTPKIGWFRRQKITHFTYYKKVAEEFCQFFSIDPALISAKFLGVENIDFENKDGLITLGKAVDTLLLELPPESKVFVKASQGTYGMGISVVGSGEEIINMNRKTRNKMDIGKNSLKFTSVLVQEGIETAIKYDNMPAEVTIYLIDGASVGGFMRANSEKDSIGNLNSKGMVFKKLCMKSVNTECAKDHVIKEAVYSVVAQLSTIASAYEIKEVL